MILVTVGMQLGFDRLIKAMDGLAPSLNVPIIAQVGPSNYRPHNFETRAEIAPSEFEALMRQCDVVVSHAGIGTVLTAQRLGKPIVLVPRRVEFGEHRNDHQLATARQLSGRAGIFVAMTESELGDRIKDAFVAQAWKVQASGTLDDLRATVANFIATGSI